MTEDRSSAVVAKREPADELLDSFSFAGCGFLGVYHLGVASCLQQYVPHVLEKAKFAGASAGAVIACCLICGVSVDQCVEAVLEIVTEARKHALGGFNPKMKVNELLGSALERLLPSDAHTLCSGRLTLSLTRIRGISTRKNELISEFNSRAELIQLILHSSYIPLFSDNKMPVWGKHITLDGAFSNNQPKVDDHTIIISPLFGDKGICPTPEGDGAWWTLTLSNTRMACTRENFSRLKDCFFVPRPRKLKKYYVDGYTVALKHLNGSDMIRCGLHLTKYSRAHVRHDGKHKDCTECALNVHRAKQNREIHLEQQAIVAVFNRVIAEHEAEEELQAAMPGPMDVWDLVRDVVGELRCLTVAIILLAWQIVQSVIGWTVSVVGSLRRGEYRPVDAIQAYWSLLKEDPKHPPRMGQLLLGSVCVKFAALWLGVIAYISSVRIWRWILAYYRAVRRWYRTDGHSIQD